MKNINFNKNWLNYTPILLGLGLVIFFQLPAIPQNDNSNEFVDAPKPVVMPTYGYIPEPASAESNTGEKLFKSANCVQCHSVKNAGGIIGPMLDAIGHKRSPEFLYAHLARTRQAEEMYFQMTGQQRSKYMHPRLDAESAKSLVAFLMTLPEPQGGFVLTPHVMSLPSTTPQLNSSFKPAKPSTSSMQGEKIFNNKGCIACHSVKNVGGWLGPKLDGVAGRMDRRSIIENIKYPARVSKNQAGDIDVIPQMPRIKLTEEQIEQLTDYLLTLPNIESNDTNHMK